MIPFTGATRLISGQPYNCTSNANLVLSTNQVDYGNSGNKILIRSPLGNLSGQYDEFECSPVIPFHKRRNPRDEMSLRCLNQISIGRDISKTSEKHLKRHLFWKVFQTSQIHLKKDVFFVTSLRRLKYISKKMFFMWRL